ncbi:MAG: four helix bundle protein [Lacibacter sp.]|jgi:sorbitol-specific phosphotransferase system component IIBC
MMVAVKIDKGKKYQTLQLALKAKKVLQVVYMTNYKKLDVWKKAMDLVKDVYQRVKTFPPEERHALTLQTKRAAISIPCNIAEGSGRYHKKDTL